MSIAEKKMSRGWSFAAGALLGAMVVFVPLASLGTLGLKSAGPKPVPPAAVVHAVEAAAPVPAEAVESVSTTRPERARSGGKSRSSAGRERTPKHSECDLQLD